jgi:hypothetical protein
MKTIVLHLLTIVVFFCLGSTFTAVAADYALPMPIVIVALIGLPVYLLITAWHLFDVFAKSNEARYQFMQKVGLVSKYQPFPGKKLAVKVSKAHWGLTDPRRARPRSC